MVVIKYAQNIEYKFLYKKFSSVFLSFILPFITFICFKTVKIMYFFQSLRYNFEVQLLNLP
jgi:hypothetical protein